MCDKRGNNPKNDEFHYWNDYKSWPPLTYVYVFYGGRTGRWETGRKAVPNGEKEDGVLAGQRSHLSAP